MLWLYHLALDPPQCLLGCSLHTCFGGWPGMRPHTLRFVVVAASALVALARLFWPLFGLLAFRAGDELIMAPCALVQPLAPVVAGLGFGEMACLGALGGCGSDANGWNTA